MGRNEGLWVEEITVPGMKRLLESIKVETNDDDIMKGATILLHTAIFHSQG